MIDKASVTLQETNQTQKDTHIYNEVKIEQGYEWMGCFLEGDCL